MYPANIISPSSFDMASDRFSDLASDMALHANLAAPVPSLVCASSEEEEKEEEENQDSHQSLWRSNGNEC